MIGRKPFGPFGYGLLARLSDRWAARRDGHAGVPPLRSAGDPAVAWAGITPYLEYLSSHFLARAERERRRMLTGLVGTYRLQAGVRQQIMAADERAAAARKLLDKMPAGPPEAVIRNAVEQDVSEALVRARRRREYEAERGRIVRLEEEAAEKGRELRVREAELSAVIAARQQVLESRVRQLFEQLMRRCGTYRRLLVRHHPDGAAVLPYLDLALPSLPDWALSMSPDSSRADAP